MLVLLSSLGPFKRAQALQKGFGWWGQGPAWNRSTAFVQISIDGAGCSQAAFCRRPESAAYLLDFIFGQVTGASTNQYSVLVIHFISPFVIGPIVWAMALQKKS
jgi:hypothetical protein